MRVLLLEHPRVIDPERCNDIANTPLSSCLLSGYAAAIIQSKGHEVEIVEGYLDKLNYEQIKKIVADYKPQILGVHMVYHWQKDQQLYNFLQQVKDDGAVSYITVFGFYPTIAYEDILQDCAAIDSVIIGELEMTFAELVDARSSSAAFHCEGLEGMAVRNPSGGARYRRRDLLRDLDAIPIPVRTEAMYRLPEVNIQGSRGCYGACTFCYINPFYGAGSCWRGRSPENIVAEIEQIIAQRGIRDFYFTDPNFFGPGKRGQDRAKELARLLKPLEIRFGIEGRVNDIYDETIAVLREAGLRHILIGLESGRDSALKRMNKMTTVAQNEEAIRILRKHGIEPNIGFIMFEPDSNLEDIKCNFDFLIKNELLNNLPITANLLYHHQIVLKGTPAFKTLLKEGRLQLSSTYEGVTSFADEGVEALAALMRTITNYLFRLMAGIWSGRVREPEGASEKYRRINCLLVKVFAETLAELRSEKELSCSDMDFIGKAAQNKIADILADS